MTSTSTIIQKISNKIIELSKKKTSSWWYTPHMAAASRAINKRLPLVDLVVEVRDARIPFSSAFEALKSLSASSRHIIVLNKADLAKHENMEEWVRYFKKRNTYCIGVNATSTLGVSQILSFLQVRIRELLLTEGSRHTLAIMVVGIPNVGKSRLANAVHQMGRKTAEEMGKLKHPVSSPRPGDTRNIESMKIGGDPNIYLMDTPGVLPPKILDAEICCKLALIEAIDDIIVGPTDLAQYFLSIVSLGKEYQKWEKYTSMDEIDTTHMSRRKLFNHCQDFVVRNVRRTLYEAISSFDGDLGNEDDLARLIETELRLLHKVFYIPLYLGEDGYVKVATKVVDLFRTGRLGYYVLDPVPTES